MRPWGRFTTRPPEGCELLLKYDMFDYSEDKQVKKFTENIEALKNYVGVKYPKYMAELVCTVEEMELVVPGDLPNPPDGGWQLCLNNGKST